jgi:hypothetical protein
MWNLKLLLGLLLSYFRQNFCPQNEIQTYSFLFQNRKLGLSDFQILPSNAKRLDARKEAFFRLNGFDF